jgi:hypothetical protein
LPNDRDCWQPLLYTAEVQWGGGADPLTTSYVSISLEKYSAAVLRADHV